MERSTPQLTTSRLDPLTVLRGVVARFRRLGKGDPATMVSLTAIYGWEADHLDDLVSLCDGTATSNASADTLPVAVETIDASEGRQ